MKNILKEVFIGMIPILILVTILQFTIVHLPMEMYLRFLINTVFVCFGISLFLFGVNIVFVPVGNDLGSKLVETGKIAVILIFGFVVGFSVTLPEPAVQTVVGLVRQINPALSDSVILIITALGVGIATLAFLTFFLRLKYKYVVTVGFGLLIILMILAPAEFRSMALDVGALTTGSLTVPFFMAIGVGISAITSKSSDNQASFGILAITSLGPILAILILGIVTSWF